MTAKEKAEELVTKFVDLRIGNKVAIEEFNLIKRCALICVDELIRLSEELAGEMDHGVDCDMVLLSYDYYNKVKQEIEKL